MPRAARIDFPGALHHIIVQGVKRQDIFVDSKDKNEFLVRFERSVTDTNTRCFAWALIPNHFHLLLETGHTPVSKLMLSLLTSYARYFNRQKDWPTLPRSIQISSLRPQSLFS